MSHRSFSPSSLVTIMIALQVCACDSSPSKSSSNPSGSGAPKKSLDEREDALFDELVKISLKDKDDCGRMGDDAEALVKRESATVDEINEAFSKMSASDKAARKDRSQKRAQKSDGLGLIICSVKNKKVAEAQDKIIPSTK